MRRLEDITKDEIGRVNEILEDEYSFGDSLLGSYHQIEYQCFYKSHACFSGRGVVRVYEYLKSIGINILDT